MRRLSCLALAGLATIGSAEALISNEKNLLEEPAGHSADGQSARSQRLAVVVPAYSGDLSRAVESLVRWPTKCSETTQHHMDLVLYYAEGADESAGSVVSTIAESAGRCFADTKIVYANLLQEVSRRLIIGQCFTGHERFHEARGRQQRRRISRPFPVDVHSCGCRYFLCTTVLLEGKTYRF